MNTPSLTAYRFTVVLGDPGDPATLRALDVTAYGRDIQKVEALFGERKWGAVDARPITAAVAACYFALLRTGEFAGTFDAFEAAYLEVSSEEPVKVFPTEAEAVPASP